MARKILLLRIGVFLAGLFVVCSLLEIYDIWEQSQVYVCRNHLMKLAHAVLLYTADNDGRLPLKESWQTQISANYLQGIKNPQELFHCNYSDKEFSYAFNASVSGAKLSELDENRIILFESDLGTENAYGSEKDESKPRHFGDNYAMSAKTEVVFDHFLKWR
ncbi:MAG: hypothetical protein JSS72_01205 [Armatimonadetes bacterium]|nr:hypothetical protein [Armatimonadota bacterium]